ncbi:MAG: 3-oxoacyl-(acyl-carrier-protein) synthase [Chloroflexi bacterium]|jgi:3-oxoacyl-[acyl-carrier-protein] synthase-3|nr:3-oxoacyl-(acyl-carrier-protein) synthase [Chloroflexota bacterium]
MREPVRSTRITGWGMHAPELVLTNADLARIVDTSDEWIISRTGIRERRVAGPDETAASMAAIAGRRAIAVAGLEPDDIDLIVVATLTPDHLTPSTATLVREAIGNTRAAAMDLNAACSGFVYGYVTAHAFIKGRLARHVLVIGSDLLTRFLDYDDRTTCVLFGDGAGAVVLSASPEPSGAHGIEIAAEPAGAYKLWIPAGGSRRPASPESVARGEHYLRMDGPDVYRYATRAIAATARTAIERARLRRDDIDLFIPHQANSRIIEAVARGLHVPMERMFVNLDRYGNTSAASIPIALAEAVDSGRVAVGDRLLVVAFGAGFTAGAVAFEWAADPAAGGRAAAIDASSVAVRRAADWQPPNPLPAKLAALLAASSPAAPDGAGPDDASHNPVEAAR